jgi:lysozyme
MRAALNAILLVASCALLALLLYRSGRVQFNHPSADSYPITGIDVSHHQGPIDWADA